MRPVEIRRVGGNVCFKLYNACLIDERIVLRDSPSNSRAEEASALALAHDPLVRDYVWGGRLAHISDRGTFSAEHSPPSRYCALNSTLTRFDMSPTRSDCVGDADEGDGVSHWISIDAERSKRLIRSAPNDEREYVVAWTVYPQSFTESFTNTAISLHELGVNGLLHSGTLLVPSSFQHVGWLAPFGQAHMLQRNRGAQCFRTGFSCRLASFVFDHNHGAGDHHTRPAWHAMQRYRPYLKHRQPAPLWRGLETIRRIRILFVKRSGRRRILNVDDLMKHCRSHFSLDLDCTAHEFGTQTWRIDANRAAEADVFIAPHGAELVHALLMQNGSSVVEVRPYGFTPDLGMWSSYFEILFGFQNHIHHYAVQLGPQQTGLQGISHPDATPHRTWNMNMRVPVHVIGHARERWIRAIHGSLDSYLRLRRQKRHVMWTPGSSIF